MRARSLPAPEGLRYRRRSARRKYDRAGCEGVKSSPSIVVSRRELISRLTPSNASGDITRDLAFTQKCDTITVDDSRPGYVFPKFINESRVEFDDGQTGAGRE